MSELVKKLLTVQATLKAPKGQYNSFGKYHYRSAEDILEAVKPLNAEHGLLLTLSDTPEIIGSYQYIKATARITDGEAVHEVTAYAREALNQKGKDESQITGTASSYARKYALNGLYLIDDTKDADTDEHQKQQQDKPKQDNTVSPQQIKMIGAKVQGIAKANEQAPAAVYQSATKHLGIDKARKDLTKQEASKLIEYLVTLE